jgi:hypothetical protein
VKKIIVHNPCNEHTKNYRNYNNFWDKLTLELRKKYDVIENRYYEFANSKPYQIKLLKGLCNNFSIQECDYVIEFVDSGDFYILSVSDRLSVTILDEQNNPHLKKVLLSQFNYESLKHHTKENILKYHPWIYFPQNVLDYEYFYKKRLNINTKIDKMFFRGTTTYRPITEFFDKKLIDGFNSIPNYLDELIKYKMGLSIAGVGELCYRDIEYMCIGIPFIRFEYLGLLNPKLIPNYHYISVGRPDDIPKHNGLSTDRLGLYEHAKMIEKKFLEVKDDFDFLNFVSNNSREYYETYLSENNVKYTLELLEL